MHTRVISIVRLAVIGALIGVLFGVWSALSRPKTEVPPRTSSGPPALLAAAAAAPDSGSVSPQDARPVWCDVIRAHLAAKDFPEVKNVIQSMRSPVDQGDAITYIVSLFVEKTKDFELDTTAAHLIGADDADSEASPEFDKFKDDLIDLARAIEDPGVSARAFSRIAMAQAVTHSKDPTIATTLQAMDSAYEKHRMARPSAWKRLVEGWGLVTKSGLLGSLGALFTALVVNTIWFYVEAIAGWAGGKQAVRIVKKVHDSGVDSAESATHTSSPAD
jgi:hypothetical protein